MAIVGGARRAIVLRRGEYASVVLRDGLYGPSEMAEEEEEKNPTPRGQSSKSSQTHRLLIITN